MNNEIKTIPPFKKFCMSIGTLPSSFYSSMSYYESMVWLYEYIKNELIPVINNNSEVTQEIQSTFSQLEEYITNYFENLDLQEEVNNKLDEMAEDGSLTELIKNYSDPILNELVTETEATLSQINTNITENFDTINTLNSNKNYIHISFDDVTTSISQLTTNASTYTSIYDNTFFNYLRNLHNSYGAKFSLYVFTNTFTSLPTKYKDDFLAANEWLKIGFHATDGDSNFANTNYATAQTAYNQFTSDVINKCGSSNSIDRCPRLGNFAGNYGALSAVRDANGGCLGFLTADDTRLSYYFSNLQNNYINKYFNYFDHETGLFFVKSITRLESMDNIAATLNGYLNTSSKCDGLFNFEIFTHESEIYSSGEIQNQWLETVCQFAEDNNIRFDYLQNKIQNNRSMVANEKRIINFFTSSIETALSPSNLAFKNGTLTDYIPVQSSTTGRAVATKLLQTPVNSKINFSNQLGYGISYALVEYGSDPISAKQLDGGETYARWLNDAEFTLNANTKYLQIVVKHTDNSTTDFTDQELTAIGNSFTIS